MHTAWLYVRDLPCSKLQVTAIDFLGSEAEALRRGGSSPTGLNVGGTVRALEPSGFSGVPLKGFPTGLLLNVYYSDLRHSGNYPTPKVCDSELRSRPCLILPVYVVSYNSSKKSFVPGWPGRFQGKSEVGKWDRGTQGWGPMRHTCIWPLWPTAKLICRHPATWPSLLPVHSQIL